MQQPDITIDIRRVGWNYYTYHLRLGSTTHVGHGSKRGVRQALSAAFQEHNRRHG